MHIRLLGACQILWQDRPLRIVRRQVRALLFRLAAAPEPVSREQLAFLFWPDVPTNLARRQLTRLLTALRGVLPQPEILLVDEETVALAPTLLEVDSRQLLAAIHATDTATLEDAVRLYTGPFMHGFHLPEAVEYEAWQAETARRLERLYLSALDQLVQALTLRGDLEAAVVYARQYLAVDELDETMHRRLISLHLASGNGSAAQQQYEQCVLVLERELGVSPLPATQAALLTRESRTTAAPLPSHEPQPEPPFAGREQILEQLHRAARRFANGGFVLITGEPGIGKSRLLREFAAGLDSFALRGEGHPGNRHLPFQPVVQALRAAVDPLLWAKVPAVWRTELLPLMPELRQSLGNLLDPLETGSEHAWTRLLEALLQALAIFPRPMTFYLDDLHWIDEATLGWLSFLASRLQETGLLVVATARTASAHTLVPVRQSWEQTRCFAHIEIQGLDLAAVNRLLSTFAVSADLAARVHAMSGGNPYFILEIANYLRESGQVADPPRDLPLPATVRDAIAARLRALTPLGRQLFEAAAVLVPVLDEPLLEQVAARTPAEVADGLDELLAHQLLNASRAAERTPSLMPAHDLLRQVVYQRLSPWRRRLLHRRAADALVARRNVPAAVLARHFAAAHDWEAALRYWQLAATEAEQAHAFAVALEHLQRAFALLDRLPDPSRFRLTLLRQRLALHRILVHLEAWQSDIAELSRLADITADVDAQLDVLEGQISLHVLNSDFVEMETVSMQALDLAEQNGRFATAARVRRTLGWHLADALGRSQEALQHLEEAGRLAEATGQRRLLYQVLCNQAFALRAEGRCGHARDTSLRALSLTSFGTAGELEPEFADASRELAEANAYLARWEEAWYQLRDLARLYETLQDPWAHGAVLFNLGLYSANMGQHAAAVDSMRKLVTLSEEVGLPADSDYGIWHRSGLVRVLIAAGALDEAGRLLNTLDTRRLQPGRPYLAWARAAAEYHRECHDAAAALALLQPAVTWWRQAASLHDADVLLQLALAQQAAGYPELARSNIGEATALLAPTDIERYRIRLHAARYLVLGTADDLAQARAALQEQAARFMDEALRAAFLRDVALHRGIAA